jgi:hypothetical protein
MANPSFPVLLDHDFRLRTARSLRETGACLSCVGIPQAMLRDHLDQFYLNHGKSIHQLAQMGGLAADECLAILEDRRWLPIDEADAHTQLVRAVLNWQNKVTLR